MTRKIRITQKRKSGTVTYLTEDKGKLGKTPESEQWYKPVVVTGWKKDMPEKDRRPLVLEAHEGDELTSARAMLALANVTTDKETKAAARADGLYFLREYTNKNSRRPNEVISRRVIISKRPLRITPKTPKLE
jgi:hypothetical protein